MNTAIVIVITVATLYFVTLLLTLWGVSNGIRRHLDKAVILIREQRNEDLRWHRDSLLSHMRADQARNS